MIESLWLLPLLCLAAAVLTLAFGRWLPLKGAFLGVAATGWSLIQVSWTLAKAISHEAHLPYEASIEWLRVGAYEFTLGLYVDGMTLTLLLVVTLVSCMVHVYSLGYMHGDPRFKRFYFFLGLFTFSMLGLTMADNMLQFFICWEIMGACSYFLIGFWFEKPEAAYAAKKAFITTKLGDLGFFLGLMVLFADVGTFRISQLMAHVDAGYLAAGTATTVALLFFAGSVGKSAQVPLFVWLPDAMQGPTPVSALIHAATMVAAGVYLVARVFFIFQIAPLALEIVAWVGMLTAFLAATMAVVAYDLKQVLAWSTISQLGYMMLALGVGGKVSGMFHLTTHAFFKALLFLGAGSVIHAVHTNDIREMGGLSKKMPATFLTMAAATLAICGFPGFAGYFSKDMILADAGAHSLALFWLAVFTAGMTAFYMSRMFFLTFLGAPRSPERFAHAHESPPSMTGPLVVLAFMSVFSGWFFNSGHRIQHLIDPAASTLAHGAHGLSHNFVMATSSTVVILSLLFGYYCYVMNPAFPERMRERLSGLVDVLLDRYGFDRFYLGLVDLADVLTLVLFWFDQQIVDRLFVDGWGYVTLAMSRVQAWFDDVFVDGTVDGFGTAAQIGGRTLRLTMTGLVQNYLLYIAFTAALFAWMVLRL